MDDLAIIIVRFYDQLAHALGADTLLIHPTPSNGYKIASIDFFLIFGNEFFFFWQRD